MKISKHQVGRRFNTSRWAVQIRILGLEKRFNLSFFKKQKSKKNKKQKNNYITSSRYRVIVDKGAALVYDHAENSRVNNLIF